MLNYLLGTGVSAYNVVIVLELILAVYSVSLALCTERKTLKIIHALSAVLWVVLALSNIFI